MIKQSKDWAEFIQKMTELGYEIKFGKYIAFKKNGKESFTRAKTIGADYTEEQLKERILENANQKTFTVKKRVGNIIDIVNNPKIQQSNGYAYRETNIIYKSLPTLSFPCVKRAFKALLNLIIPLKKVQIKDKAFRKKSRSWRKKSKLYPCPWSKPIT